MTPTSQLIVQLLSRKTQGSKEVGFCTWVEVFPAKKKPHTLQWVSNHVITSLLYLHFDDVYSRNRNKVRLFWRWCRRKHVIMSWSSLWNRCDTVNPRSSVAAEGWSWLTLLLSQPYIHFYYILYGFFYLHITAVLIILILIFPTLFLILLFQILPAIIYFISITVLFYACFYIFLFIFYYFNYSFNCNLCATVSKTSFHTMF